MKILISNDDGIFAMGLRTLANRLAAAGHAITVVCPDRERSATGHGLTMHKPLRVDPVAAVFAEGIAAWACSGTPSDCVKLALDAILPTAPDLVLSGINHGANLGTDVLYSGTVSAAMEGVLEGIPAIALSLVGLGADDFQPAAEFAHRLVAGLGQQPLGLPILLNVNVPSQKVVGQIRGVKIARQGMRRWYDQFEKRTDPRGKTYYWLAGKVVEEGNAELPAEPELMAQKQFPTDVTAIKEGFITLTPLQYNLTAYSGLSALADWSQYAALEQVLVKD